MDRIQKEQQTLRNNDLLSAHAAASLQHSRSVVRALSLAASRVGLCSHGSDDRADGEVVCLCTTVRVRRVSVQLTRSGGSCASLELLPLLFWRPASARTQRRAGLLFISSIDPPLNKADHLDFGAETASELRMLTDPSCSRLASKIQRTTGKSRLHVCACAAETGMSGEGGAFLWRRSTCWD